MNATWTVKCVHFIDDSPIPVVTRSPFDVRYIYTILYHHISPLTPLQDHLWRSCDSLALKHNMATTMTLDSRSKMGHGKLRSYLEPVYSISNAVSAAEPEMYPGTRDAPPGAVGGRYGSGCFHFSSKFSVSLMRSCCRCE